MNGVRENRFSDVWLTGLACLLLVFVAGCDLIKKQQSESPAGYDLNHPVLIKLPTELDEISGVAYYPKDTCVFAIVDEVGVLYKIYLNRPKQIEKWIFGERSDYEDIVLLDSNFYVLSSEGSISAFRFFGSDTLAYKRYPLTSIGKGNEFEILYFDKKLNKIVMVCKDCERDRKDRLSCFEFDPYTFEYNDSRLVIDALRIAELVGETKIKFKPSAASIHPLTGELFIISAINKMLVVADRNGKAKGVYKLNGGDFKQPEGLTFTPAGDLIISNEAAEHGVANIMIFPYNSNLSKGK